MVDSPPTPPTGSGAALGDAEGQAYICLWMLHYVSTLQWDRGVFSLNEFITTYTAYVRLLVESKHKDGCSPPSIYSTSQVAQIKNGFNGQSGYRLITHNRRCTEGCPNGSTITGVLFCKSRPGHCLPAYIRMSSPHPFSPIPRSPHSSPLLTFEISCGTSTRTQRLSLERPPGQRST